MLVLPISFLPLMIDSFGTGKNWILMSSSLLGVFLWGVTLFFEKEKEVKLNKVWWIMSGLVIFAWLQWYFKLTPGVKMRGIVEFGGVGTITAWWMWLFLWLQTSNDRKTQINWMAVSGVIIGIFSIVLFLYPEAKLPIVWPKTNTILNITTNFSITGSLSNEVILILFLLVWWVQKLVLKLKKDENYLREAIIGAFLSLVVSIDIFRLIKTGGMAYMDNNTSWVIMVETFKRLPIWGIGAGNFVEAFFTSRPNSYNLTQYWANWFKYSSMGILNLWTELGTVGLALTAMIGLKVWNQKKNFETVRMILMGLLIALIPYHFMGVWLMIWLLVDIEGTTAKLDLAMYVEEKRINVGIAIVAVLVFVTSIFGGYWMNKILMGEYYMRKSMTVTNRYEMQAKAISYLSLMAEYHKNISLTNLSLAGEVLVNKELSETDKTKVSTLIQQSINEAKMAIELDKNNPTYWLNLAVLYRQLIGIVNGAADWSFQAYEQAVILEPANATSRLEMGGLLYASGRYDEADRVFEAVLLSKMNFANGWYNWAHSAKQMNKLSEAVARLTQALTLVPVSSGDYDVANGELIKWRKELDDLNLKQKELLKPETLTNPSAIPTKNKEVVVPTQGLEPANLQSTT